MIEDEEYDNYVMLLCTDGSPESSPSLKRPSMVRALGQCVRFQAHGVDLLQM